MTRRRWLWAAMVVLAAALLAAALLLRGDPPAQARGPAPAIPNDPFFRTIGEPLSALPAVVKAPDGRVTVFADYRSRDADGVPIYLVNRSNGPLEIRSDSSYFHPLMEAQMEDGVWRRAQTTEFSWCGNSYADFTLPAQQFHRLKGDLPREGRERPVRFRLHSHSAVVSNVGAGLVTDAMIKTASRDAIAVSQGGFELAADICFGKPDGAGQSHGAERAAFHRLQELADPRTGPLIRKVLDEPNHDGAWAGMEIWLKVAEPEAVAYGTALLRDPSRPHRRDVLKAMRGCEFDPEFRRLLVELMKDRDERVAKDAFESFSWRRRPDVRPTLERLVAAPETPKELKARAGEWMKWDAEVRRTEAEEAEKKPK